MATEEVDRTGRIVEYYLMLPESIFVTTIVIAITQLIKFIREKAWDSVVTLVSAGVVGGVAGAFGIEGLTVVTGILAGLAAAGIVTVASKLGGS